ncbi:MAG: hypothetical protein IJD21_01940 [Oscillospiraceae bacterium]|nr:hypothetical protein [Oscillospiraceae bacterium]
MASNNRPQPNGGALGLRAVVLLYTLYMAFRIAAGYLRGDNDALSLPLTILAVVFIGGLSCLMLFMTWKQWQELKNAPPAEDEDEDEEEDAERGDEQALPPAEEES